MRYLALACDYDGTLAFQDKVDPATFSALAEVRASGRKLILVTGRRLDELRRVCPNLDLFDRVVAENGALLHEPASGETELLCERAPEILLRELRRRGVSPLEVGEAIIGTWHPNEATALDAIYQLGLEHQVIFNNGAVMILPPGVNKASGLRAALAGLELSPHNVAGIGDAENDHAFLALCECGAAVANALPQLKSEADLVTTGAYGAGVAELAGRLLANDLAEAGERLHRHDLLVGWRDEAAVMLPPFGRHLLLAGSSGHGKTTMAYALLEHLSHRGYQYLVVDPEGDYTCRGTATVLGTGRQPAAIDTVISLLEHPRDNVVVTLIGLPLEERPGYFAALAERLSDLRRTTGRPHWLVIDEAHHVLPANGAADSPALLAEPQSVLLATVYPEHIHASALSTVDTLVTVGPEAPRAIRQFCTTLGVTPPPLGPPRHDFRQALLWDRRTQGTPLAIRAIQPQHPHRRHQRKYAEGYLSPHKSFFFRGPEGRVNLRAHNLQQFLRLAERIDDDTWRYHLERGDYSRWVRETLRDEECAGAIAEVEHATGEPAARSRAEVKAAVERCYGPPA